MRDEGCGWVGVRTFLGLVRLTGPMIISLRRALFLSAGALVTACRRDGDGAQPPGSAGLSNAPPSPSPNGPHGANPAPYGTPTTRVADLDSGRVCLETHDNIEGPYYRAGAPQRSDLVDRGMQGTPLEIAGRVTGIDCATALRDAKLEVWQANAAGHYDNDGSFGPTGAFMMLRGLIAVDGDGRYRVKTIVPGRYLNGKQYRPAHVHVKVTAQGYSPLTTQLYFPGDPYNDIDPFIHKSLIMQVARDADRMKAAFDFVLRPA